MALSEREERTFARIVARNTATWHPPTFEHILNTRQAGWGVAALLAAAVALVGTLASSVWVAGLGVLVVLGAADRMLRTAHTRKALLPASRRGGPPRAGWWALMSGPRAPRR